MIAARGPWTHLLRPFTGWSSGPKVDDAEAWIATRPRDGEFVTWTTREPRRQTELQGGSFYFVPRKKTIFRMPFIRVEAAVADTPSSWSRG